MRGRDSAVNHLRRTHKDPVGILASASNPARFAAAWARGKFNVVWDRSLDAAAHGTIHAGDMVNIAGFRHDSPPTQKVDDGLLYFMKRGHSTPQFCPCCPPPWLASCGATDVVPTYFVDRLLL